jgi:cellulose synthase/poly-beta-1,6-N-acetylglucosamine synthase-like glycosyltransferase
MVKIALDLRILTKLAAKANPVGEANTEPNFEPYLPPPVGRIVFSLNPMKMLGQMFSPEFATYICMILCFILCIVALIMMIPTFFSDLFAEGFISLFS